MRNGLVDVAVSICARPDFVEINNISPGGYTCLMLAIKNDLPDACLAVLRRRDFELLNKRNDQTIERTAYQMAKKKATPSIHLSKMRDLDKKYEILSHCENFKKIAGLIQSDSSFVLDMVNAWTVQ